MSVFVPFFEPDANRAAAIDFEVRRRLAGALSHIAERSRPHVELDDAKIEALCQALQQGERLRPLVFGLYNDLVAAARRDDLDAVAAHWQRLAEEPIAAKAELTLRDFSETELADWERSIYGRAVSNEGDAQLKIAAPGSQEARIGRAAVLTALALLEEAAPEMAAEIRALILEIILAVNAPDSEMRFGGVSSFLVWGTLFLNAEGHTDPIMTAQALAHESAHSLLHGFAVDDPLVLNPSGTRYNSPLRRDPRPMDGIYHAVWVSARMHYAARRIAELATHSESVKEQLREDLELNAHNFWSGLETVREHGQLTERGRELMAAAETYMASHTRH